MRIEDAVDVEETMSHYHKIRKQIEDMGEPDCQCPMCVLVGVLHAHGYKKWDDAWYIMLRTLAVENSADGGTRFKAKLLDEIDFMIAQADNHDVNPVDLNGLSSIAGFGGLDDHQSLLAVEDGLGQRCPHFGLAVLGSTIQSLCQHYTSDTVLWEAHKLCRKWASADAGVASMDNGQIWEVCLDGAPGKSESFESRKIFNCLQSSGYSNDDAITALLDLAVRDEGVQSVKARMMVRIDEIAAEQRTA